MQKFDLLGIGNAVVDILYKVDEEFIINNNLKKGTMTLIDEKKAKEFYSFLKKGIEVSDDEARKRVYGMTYEEWKKKISKIIILI